MVLKLLLTAAERCLPQDSCCLMARCATLSSSMIYRSARWYGASAAPEAPEALAPPTGARFRTILTCTPLLTSQHVLAVPAQHAHSTPGKDCSSCEARV